MEVNRAAMNQYIAAGRATALPFNFLERMLQVARREIGACACSISTIMLHSAYSRKERALCCTNCAALMK
jgi:hypothetical protein